MPTIVLEDLPPELYDRIRKQALDRNCSVADEVVHLLRERLVRSEATAASKPRLAGPPFLGDLEPTDDELPVVVYVPPWAYPRAVLSLAWGAFRHPLRATYVDLSMGQAVRI